MPFKQSISISTVSSKQIQEPKVNILNPKSEIVDLSQVRFQPNPSPLILSLNEETPTVVLYSIHAIYIKIF